MPENRCPLDVAVRVGRYNKHGTHRRVCLSVHICLQDHCLPGMESLRTDACSRSLHMYEQGDGRMRGMCVHTGGADSCLRA